MSLCSIRQFQNELILYKLTVINKHWLQNFKKGLSSIKNLKKAETFSELKITYLLVESWKCEIYLHPPPNRPSANVLGMYRILIGISFHWWLHYFRGKENVRWYGCWAWTGLRPVSPIFWHNWSLSIDHWITVESCQWFVHFVPNTSNWLFLNQIMKSNKKLFWICLSLLIWHGWNLINDGFGIYLGFEESPSPLNFSNSDSIF